MLTPPSRIAHLATAGATARVTQIVNLTLLAPDIQEAILSLPRDFPRSGPDHRAGPAPDSGGARLGQATHNVVQTEWLALE